MPELHFVLDEADQVRLIEFALERGARFVPLWFYTERRYVELTTVEDVLASRADLIGPISIISPEFSFYPFRMRTSNRPEGTRYTIVSQLADGPSIMFLPSQTPSSGKRTVGILAHEPYYWVKDLTERIPAPVELKDLYKGMTKLVRSMGIKARQRGARSIVWISRSLAHSLDKLAIPNMELWKRESPGAR